MKLAFYGGTETVTGSKYLVTTEKTRVLVDSGLFQGVKALRRRNRQQPPFEPASLDAVVVTHAHLDHTGYLPVLVRDGFKGPIYCTGPTRNICNILLPDCGRIQEEDARYAVRKGFSRHKNPLPLYTEKDAKRVSRRFKPVELGEKVVVGDLELRLFGEGHILGAGGVVVSHKGQSVLFSGDIGRPDDPLMHKPQLPKKTPDWVVMESTYGDRLHSEDDPYQALAEMVAKTVARRGVLLIPAFAVGRAQNLIYSLSQLMKQNVIPRVPVYLNSPMARNVTRLYKSYPKYHRLTAGQTPTMFGKVKIINTAQESKALNRRKGPMVIVSASGMATGGRVLHHIRSFGPDPRNTILFVGYQAQGTRGAAMVGGASQVKIHGKYVPIRAEIARLDGFSAHADRSELTDWLRGFKTPPKQVFVVHGEPVASDALRMSIEEELGIDAHVPHYTEEIEL